MKCPTCGKKTNLHLCGMCKNCYKQMEIEAGM